MLFILHNQIFFFKKFDKNMSTFFVDNPDQELFPFQNLLGCNTPTLALIAFD